MAASTVDPRTKVQHEHATKQDAGAHVADGDAAH
jgi:hypothetical protein